MSEIQLPNFDSLLCSFKVHSTTTVSILLGGSASPPSPTSPPAGLDAVADNRKTHLPNLLKTPMETPETECLRPEATPEPTAAEFSPSLPSGCKNRVLSSSSVQGVSRPRSDPSFVFQFAPHLRIMVEHLSRDSSDQLLAPESTPGIVSENLPIIGVCIGSFH
ncbi:hypothetical protein R1sor_005076 [Riccia sorocarpa]|uniref:Uncharacterized protein n=1 Tax=Riccia sorocarpa TaxID=122646 RepID=A0ABD3HIH7_9MARC